MKKMSFSGFGVEVWRDDAGGRFVAAEDVRRIDAQSVEKKPGKEFWPLREVLPLAMMSRTPEGRAVRKAVLECVMENAVITEL